VNEKERLIVISAIAEMAKSKAGCNSLGVQREASIAILTKEMLDAMDMVNSQQDKALDNIIAQCEKISKMVDYHLQDVRREVKSSLKSGETQPPSPHKPE